MGTDIHMVVQVKRNGLWVDVDAKLQECWACDGLGERNGKPCPYCKGTGGLPRYIGRNYDVFAILADVRNGSGFAGCDTGDGFVPVLGWGDHSRRGLPDDFEIHDGYYHGDVSDFNDDEYKGFFMGEHSFSWVTLAELLSYNWERVTRKRGVVDAPHFHEWFSQRSEPKQYCGGVSGPRIKYVSLEGMMELIERYPSLKEPAEGLYNHKEAPDDFTYVTSVEWAETYAEAASTFYSDFLPKLKELGAAPEDVRLVFGFDS